VAVIIYSERRLAILLMAISAAGGL